ncbi:GTP 3',8-cyclase, mitochondrial [Cymbomonas tetramitiformis]|uniref:GTP 3',8-cyclase n=1 Tax=Cymbomonas tetramitiformis TaxID=36881 RepID=A0AAE0BSD1_9CHLO|nr:GTP 3',8-cyclase, mitochondrial [Cymbomonas tetramitiformis]
MDEFQRQAVVASITRDPSEPCRYTPPAKRRDFSTLVGPATSLAPEREHFRSDAADAADDTARSNRLLHTASRTVAEEDPITSRVQDVQHLRRLKEMGLQPTWPEAQKASQQSELQVGNAARLKTDPENMLLDSHGRHHTYLRISLTERCNLRCTYCMPPEGIDLQPEEKLLTTDEIVRLAGLFVEAGVTKIRLTGGEPTVRRDFQEVVGRVGGLPGLEQLALTTNGIILDRHLPSLASAGLAAVNISLDTLLPHRFELLTRRKGLHRVLHSIDAALEAGIPTVKVNCVVTRGVNEDELLDFVEMTRDKPINVRFIEYMPFDGNAWSSPKMVSYAEMKSTIEDRYGPMSRLQDPMTEVAKNFRPEGHAGSVSFITSMTEHFCSGCNRLRLLADGNLKVCLFGANEVSLRDALRGGASDAELRTIVHGAVQRKKARHAGMFEIARTANRPMTSIGG